MSARLSAFPSVRRHTATRLPLEGFSWNLIRHYFSKIYRGNSSFIKIWYTLQEDQYTFLVISCLILLKMRNVSDKYCRQNQNAHFMFSKFFLENFALYEVMWTNIVGPGQATDGKKAQAYCTLDILGYQHTLRICNTYRLSTATMVTRTRLDIMLRICCLSCWRKLCSKNFRSDTDLRS
jgi:hypothetical protein